MPALLPLPRLALLALLPLLAQAPKADDARKLEQDRHQGTWRVESFVSNGQETPDDIAKSIVRVVEGDHVVWKRDGKNFAGTKVELDPKADPKTIDVLPDGGPARDSRVLGIYKLEGDTLTICMADKGDPRPGEFMSVKGTGLTLMTFKREKPANKKK